MIKESFRPEEQTPQPDPEQCRERIEDTIDIERVAKELGINPQGRRREALSEEVFEKIREKVEKEQKNKKENKEK